MDDDVTIYLDDRNDGWVYHGTIPREEIDRYLGAPCPMIARLDAWSKARQPRAEGHYWIRTRIGSTADWDIAEWCGHWDRCGYILPDHYVIDERRILPPA
jgi:hypothetical protein